MSNAMSPEPLESLKISSEPLLQILQMHGGKALKTLSECAHVTLGLRGDEIRLSGRPDQIMRLEITIKRLEELIKMGVIPEEYDVRQAYLASAENSAQAHEPLHQAIALSVGKKSLHAKSPAQAAYIAMLKKHDLIFAIGPAGTGKTYLAVAMAVAAFTAHQYERIILTRPAVEAGERLGFLPGDLAQKVDPYLRPLYDALHDMLESDQLEHLFERGLIEVAPLAFMRGRTLNKAFIILDEAQNCTREQMKMFLTRLGPDSRAVVTGDITQIDLPPQQKSGLLEAMEILPQIPEIGFCHFKDADVVRHPLVAKIIRAYEEKQAQSSK